MSQTVSLVTRKERMLNRWHAARAGRGAVAQGFAAPPEPRTIGSYTGGQHLLAGDFLFAGHLHQHPGGADLWALDVPSAAYLQELHGFGWLDDLAAVGDASAAETAQRWMRGWIARYGSGRGPGWTADLAGRRVLRWVSNGAFLEPGMSATDSAAFFRSLSRQTRFLSRRWHAAPPGLPRFEALSGLIYAALALDGLRHLLPAAQRALDVECSAQIDAEGGLPGRKPEDLLEILTLLTWAAAALEEAGDAPSQAHAAAIARIAPTLRSLRHSDGGLARFHGGGRGLDGRLDEALARARVRGRRQDTLAMGYARLSGGRTSVIIDASPPPSGRHSLDAHASTLAFELTSGRRPVIVNCGSGKGFGAEWRRAGRATPSHSTLSLAGSSSARLGSPDRATGFEPLAFGPETVPVEIGHISDGVQFQAGHDGFVPTHGLTHARTLEMTYDGRGMAGEDMLLALEDAEKARFDRMLEAAGGKGIPFDIRFHLHPDIEVNLDQAGSSVTLLLKSGELWHLRQDGAEDLRLEASVFLETGRLKPRRTNQIVLSGRAMSYATRVRWSLSKAAETAIGLRDFAADLDEDSD